MRIRIFVGSTDGAPVLHRPSTALVHVGAFPAATGAERCDRCGPAVEAYVAVRLRATGQRLDFCGHHFARFEQRLRPIVDAVQDRRGELLAREGASHA